MEIRYTTHFDRAFRKKAKNNRQLVVKIKKQVILLRNDFRHPSLKLHKLKGERAEEFSFWIEGNLRVTFMIIEDVILFTDIITHDEY